MDPMAGKNRAAFDWFTFGLVLTFKEFSGFTPWAKEMASMADGEMRQIFAVN